MLGVLALVAVAGCGPGEPSRYHVSGRVTFKGIPIPVGRIYFEPDSSKGNNGPQGFANIVQGAYNTAENGRGPTGGAMRVRIEGSDGVRIDEERTNGKPLFDPYETKADLPAQTTTKDFDVPAAATVKKPAPIPDP